MRERAPCPAKGSSYPNMHSLFCPRFTSVGRGSLQEARPHPRWTITDSIRLPRQFKGPLPGRPDFPERLLEFDEHPGRTENLDHSDPSVGRPFCVGPSAAPTCDGCGRNFSTVARRQVPTVRIEREMGPLPSISAFGSVFRHGGAVFLRNIIHRTL
jgi:hypothetical protein